MMFFLILATFISLIILTLVIVFSKSLAKSVILFMGFGLGSTILFFLLNAPDVALTEAVVGAGLSGVILLTTLLEIQTKKSV